MAKFDFTAESGDELTLKVRSWSPVQITSTVATGGFREARLSTLYLQVGDIITEVESVDEEWITGVADGKRGIVPKSYISVL